MLFLVIVNFFVGIILLNLYTNSIETIDTVLAKLGTILEFKKPKFRSLSHSISMSIQHIFLNNPMHENIRKKIQKSTTYMFPKISNSSVKASYPRQVVPQSKKVSSDKQLYISRPISEKKQIFSMNARDILNSSKPKHIESSDLYLQEIKQISIRKNNLQKQRYANKNDALAIQQSMRQTTRYINKFRTTFMIKKQQDYSISNNFSANNNTSKNSIGGYHILKELGHGGFATVHEVIHKESGVRYAMKQYHLVDALECYLKEAKLGDFFFHNKGIIKPQFSDKRGANSIVKYIQKIKINKKGYIVQEICGQNFSKMLSEIKGTFYNKQRVYEVNFSAFYQKLKGKQLFTDIMTQLCEGVKLLNSSGFVHCDLKLQNIMISYDDNLSNTAHVKIIDFGSTFQSSKGLPKITITPQYMPPELLMQFDKNISDGPELIYEKIDVWSIGCIMLEIFTGIPLWFRYKCKVGSRLDLGIFSLTNRDYSKIVKKQNELCQTLVKSIHFVSQQWEKYRPLLKQIFVMNPNKRISIQILIKKLQQI